MNVFTDRQLQMGVEMHGTGYMCSIVHVAVNQTCISQVLCSTELPAILIQGFRSFPQSLLADIELVP